MKIANVDTFSVRDIKSDLLHYGTASDTTRLGAVSCCRACTASETARITMKSRDCQAEHHAVNVPHYSRLKLRLTDALGALLQCRQHPASLSQYLGTCTWLAYKATIKLPATPRASTPHSTCAPPTHTPYYTRAPPTVHLKLPSLLHGPALLLLVTLTAAPAEY